MKEKFLAPMAEEERVMFCISDKNELFIRVSYYESDRYLKEVIKVKSMILKIKCDDNERYEQGFKLKMSDGNTRYVLPSNLRDYNIILQWIHRRR